MHLNASLSSSAAVLATLLLGGCNTTDGTWAAERCEELRRAAQAAELESCIAEQRAWIDYNRFRGRAFRP